MILALNDISERCTGSARRGGKAHLFGRRGELLENKEVSNRSEGMGGNSQVLSSQFTLDCLFPRLIPAGGFTFRLSAIVTGEEGEGCARVNKSTPHRD